ncbi:MAG: response regulator [Myxococcales bacterium]|nr:response regulator [Myxococcales bacterium]
MTTATPRPNHVLQLEDGPSQRVSHLPNVRVLLVEDDYDAARLSSRRLAWSPLANFQVDWAASLPEGFEHIERDEYDALVLDLSLPGSEGVSTIAAVCALARHLPIVILTGNDNDELAVAALRHGAQDYLVKDDQTGRSIARAVLAAVERQRRVIEPAAQPRVTPS